MALGMRNPNSSHWGPQEKFNPPEKKTISPIRTWDIEAALGNRSRKVEQNGQTLYTINSHFTAKKDPYITLHYAGDEKTSVAGAKLDDKGKYHIYLGDLSSETGVGAQECEVVDGGNFRARNHRFSPPGEDKDYAWRDTEQYELSIEGSKEETTGRDFKLISVDAEGEEDELLAVYIHNPKASLKDKAKIFWVGKVDEEVELWGMAALLGLVERERKSLHKWNFTAVVGAGATM